MRGWTMPARWSKWWWFQLYSLPAWSADERRAAIVHAVTALAVFLVTWATFAFFIAAMKFEFNVTLIVSFLIVLLGLGRTIARVADNIFPDTVAKGDQAAARRVGSKVYFPDESPGIWWTSYRTMGNKSQEEDFVVRVVYCVALPILFPTLLILPPLLRILFELDKRTSILATMVTTVPLAFVFGRKICAWGWPDISGKADANAWARFNRRNRIRNLGVDDEVQRMMMSCDRNQLSAMTVALETVCKRIPPDYDTDELRRSIADAMIASARGFQPSRLDFEKAGMSVLSQSLGNSVQALEPEQPWISLRQGNARP
jgi:hypothetical protein